MAGWCLGLVAVTALPAQGAEPSIAMLDAFHKNVRPVLAKYCFACHGPKKQKGDIRLDTLSPDLINGRSAETWHDALNNLNLGEMPPDNKSQPTKAERLVLTGWMTAALKNAAAVRRSTGGKVVVRRLTRYEYNNTMRDLLGIDLDFAENLPPEPLSQDGFKNSGQALGFSPIQMEYYLQSARLALSKAIVSGPPPEVTRCVAQGTANQKLKQFGGKNVLPSASNGRVFPGEAFRIKSKDFPREGLIRVRVAAAAFMPEGTGRPRLRVSIGHKADTQSPSMVLGEVDMKPVAGIQTFEFTGRIEQFPLPGHNPKFPGVVIAVSNQYEPEIGMEVLRKRRAAIRKRLARAKAQAAAARKSRGKDPKRPGESQKGKPPRPPAAKIKLPAMPAVVVKSIEFEGPIFESWPPASHTRILPPKPSGLAESTYARQVIKRFMSRAYRRPTTTDELSVVHDFYESIRPQTPTFLEAIRESLAMVLISPEFLYLMEPAAATNDAQPLTAHELAARLSYFLWSTMPDDLLLRAADSGTLTSPAELASQARRMIADQRFDQFVEHFTSQWLDLSGLERIAVNPEYYPDFDNRLKGYMRTETIAFVGEIVRKDLSAMTLIDSDFAMLNLPLARHYGITGPTSMAFEPVALKASDRRGGLLTQASVLMINSTGEDSHPIRRAVWVRERLLDDPPPPPPPDVPELQTEDPEFASLSLKRQLELHRGKASCRECHLQIDPWGIPFEHYDAIGKWRTKVNRVISTQAKRKGKRKRRQGRFVTSPVVASSTLPGGYDVAGMADLKAHLKNDKKRKFSQALVRKVLTYSLGRSLEFSDGPQVQELLKTFEEHGYKLRELVLSIAMSKAFSTK